MLEQKDVELLERMFSKSENLILSEVERTRKILDSKIDVMQNDVDEIKQYYRIQRLQDDNNSLFLQML